LHERRLQLAQLKAEGRVLDAQRANLLAQVEANSGGLTSTGQVAGPKDLALTERLLGALGDTRTKQFANSQAQYDLATACGLPR
jgi:hypothetical protein